VRDYRSIPLGAAEDVDFSSTLRDLSVKKAPVARSKSIVSFRRPKGKVGDQGNLGSCVGWTMRVVMQDLHPSSLSALWVYYKAQKNDSTPGSDYSGTTVSGACRAIHKEGICQSKYEDGGKYFKAGAGIDALKRRIEGHSTVRASDFETIKALVQEKVLATSIHIHEEFYNIDSSGFLNEDNYLKSPRKGGHAVAVVGWRCKDGKNYLRFENSWSEEFGDKGDFYLSADLFKEISKGVYVVHKSEMTLYERILNLLDRLRTKLIFYFKKYNAR